MKALRHQLMMHSSSDEEMQIAAMIDVFLLLLIYLMASSSLVKPEADLGFKLPGTVVQSTSLRLPDEQIVEVSRDGQVFLNGQSLDAPGGHDLPGLRSVLVRFKQASQAAGTQALVTIQPDQDTVHERVIDVLNACAEAGITGVSFGS